MARRVIIGTYEACAKEQDHPFDGTCPGPWRAGARTCIRNLQDHAAWL